MFKRLSVFQSIKLLHLNSLLDVPSPSDIFTSARRHSPGSESDGESDGRSSSVVSMDTEYYKLCWWGPNTAFVTAGIYIYLVLCIF